MALLAMLLATGALWAAAGHGSIIYLRASDAVDLDPRQAQDVYSTEVALNVFEGLVRFKKDSRAVEPCLATSWSVADNGRRWSFTLRRGVRFHDGTPFDARAVLDSFQGRSKDEQGIPGGSSPMFPFIAGVRSNGPYSVEITLKRPYAPFLIALADSTALIVPLAARQTGHFRPNGTGPFRFLSWSRGKSLVLAGNPEYWGGAPRLEKIVFKVMSDPAGRVLQIKNGSADMIKILSGREYGELAFRSDIAILRHASTSTHYLGFNTRKKPFDRKEVRAAFLHLIDKGSLIKRIFQSMATPAYSPLPPPLSPVQGVQPVNSFNPAVARILLERAGLAAGFPCTLYIPAGQQGIEEVANLLTVMAKKIKVTVRKIKLPFSALIEAADRGEHDMILLGWSTSPDPDFFLYPLFTLSPGRRNRFFYDNAELTRLLDRGKTTLDPLQRDKVYLEALAILKKDVPWIPLYHPLSIMACSKKLGGLAINPLGQVLFREAAKVAD